MNCAQCSNPTTVNTKFCSHSCSATYHNLIKAKRRVEGKCKKCFVPISTSRKYCLQHKGTRVRVAFKNSNVHKLTLAEVAQQHSSIRNHARRVLRHIPQVCCNCGYDKHVQAAHKKAIILFDPSSLISEINSPDNLMWLCPNCHWEYDHGLLAKMTSFDLATSTLTE